jgi:hypothetical protein
MKTYITLFILFISVSAMAQKDSKERIQALKTAYLTEQLELTSKEAQSFWPIYNTYSERLQNLYVRERREIKEELRNCSNELSETKSAQLIETFMTIEEDKLKERRDLVKNLKSVISKKKTIKLFKAEDDFRHRLLKEYRERRHKEE